MTNNKYNVFEINRIFLEPEAPFIRLIPEGFKHDSTMYCVVTSVLKVIKNLFLSILCAPTKYKFAGVETYSHYYDGTILFRIPTLNNKRSLAPIIDKVKSVRDNVQVIEKELSYDTYPILQMDMVSLRCLPSLWRGFRNLTKQEKLIVNFNIDKFVYTPGVVWFYKKIFNNFRPECVVLANDHTFVTKPLELLCEEHSIPCIYVQHASVSYAFPELHFSCSFLDGSDAYKKYTSGEKKSNGNIILLGAARYDSLSKYRMRRSVKPRKCIGLGINELDDNKLTDEVCETLLKRFPDWKIKVRSHPSMKSHPFVFTNKDRIIYTCATDENMIDYLDSIDLQISNDSGVHLDAILGGVRSIVYNLSLYPFGDNYGYLKSGLLHLAENTEQLCRFVADETYMSVDVEIVRQYDESYGKTYAGHCSDIISEFILSKSNMRVLSDKYKLEKNSLGDQDYYVIKN